MPDFRQLMDRLQDLKKVPSRVASEASEEIASLIDAEFSRGVNPYGEPWAPLRPATLAKGRTPPPLTDTGDMRGSIEVKPMQGAGIQITIGSEYATFHQTGTSRMAKRAILPDGTELPAPWSDAIGRSTTKAVAATMGSK